MSLSLVAWGAVTPVGLDAPSTAAAFRAGIAAPAEHPFMIDKYGEPMLVACVPGLTADFDALARLIELAKPAFADALASAPPRANLHLRLALPEWRPGLPDDLAERLLEALMKALSPTPGFRSAYATMGGAAAGLELLADVAKVLRDNPGDGVVLGGLDTHVVPETLEWWDEQDLLHGEQMPWGFCPGEAAAFLVFTSGDAGGVRAMSLGTGDEPNRIRTRTICLGEGLTAAWRKALSGAGVSEKGVRRLFVDLNGEPYRADEYAFTYLRLGRLIADDAAYDVPARSWGDVGAAFGPLAFVLTAEAVARGYASWPFTLVSAGSDGGRRAAAVINVG